MALVVACFWGGNQSEPAFEDSISGVVQTEQEEVTTQAPEPTKSPEKETPKKEREEKEITAVTENPTPPEEILEPTGTPSCTLTVRCDAVLQNMEKLTKGKETIVPKDGVIYPEQRVKFSQGESAFDVLYREMREHNIHFEFVKTPMYNSIYIEGIGNLYEFDCGDTSGWMYRVNGEKPNYGCSQYEVQDGDSIVFYYSCSLS